MRVKILGSAAGGGFPQWNCACQNCRRFRAGQFRGKARTQTQVAVTSKNDGKWYLLNASPDLRSQINATPELQPRDGLRSTPIAAVVLTSAEIDHVVGLLHLREFQPLRIYATGSVRFILNEENSMFSALQRMPEQAVWTDIRAGEAFDLAPVRGPASELLCTPIGVSEEFPEFATRNHRIKLPGGEAVLGLRIESKAGRKRLVFLPGLPRVDDSLLEELKGCDLVLVDGTFWADDELLGVGGGRRASEMGHLPISGPEGSLSRLARLTKPRKIFVHINNTNPILDEESEGRRVVLDAGWEVAEDGWDFQI